MPQLPNGEQYGVTCADPHRALYAIDTIRIQGVKTFGWQHAKHLDESLSLHWHRDCFEFHYLISGSLNFIVDGQRYALKGGDVFFTFPNEWHQSGDQTIIRKMYWFSIEDTDALLNLEPSWAKYLINGLHNLKNRVIPVGNEMKQLLKEVFQNLTSSNPGCQMYASAQMASFLHKLIEYDRRLVERSISDEIRRAIDYIEQNRHRSISLEEVAQHCHLSVSHFQHRFKIETGNTSAFYIKQQRIEYAKELLQAGRSVTETAYQLGFCTSSYFSTVFRQVTSMTPSQYIKNLNQ